MSSKKIRLKDENKDNYAHTLNLNEDISKTSLKRLRAVQKESKILPPLEQLVNFTLKVSHN